MVSEAVSSLSGGEKARLVLAMIVRTRPQLLILDEPTNHLDIEMREALAEALQAFDGALVVVAHDRHLLTATTDTFLLVDRGTITPFDGDLDDYRDWVLARARRVSASAIRCAERSQGAEAERGRSAPEALRAAPAADRQAGRTRARNRSADRAEAHGGRLACLARSRTKTKTAIS